MNAIFSTYVVDEEGREHDLFVEVVNFRRLDDGSSDVVIDVCTSDGLSAERLFENLPDKERERVLREAAHFAELERSTAMRSLVEYFDDV